MNPRRRRHGLVVPPRLTLSASLVAAATAGCPSPDTRDGAADVAADQSPSDGTIIDALGDALADTGDAAVADCQPMPFTPGYFACLPDPRVDGGTACTASAEAVVCTASQCAAGCRACPTSSGETGFMCLRAADAGAGVQCPGYRMCTADECPAGCPPCNAPLFCIRDPNADVMVTNCDPPLTCDPTGCGPGCRPVG